LLSSVFQTAQREWGWVDANPCRAIRKPPAPRHRERVIAWWEVRRMLRVMGYQRTGKVSSMGQAVALCMLLALRTGMRGWDDVLTLCKIFGWSQTTQALTYYNSKASNFIFGVTKIKTVSTMPSC